MEDELLNLDLHLAGYIADKLKEFADREIGHPGNFKDAEAYRAKILGIAKVLQTYTGRFDLTFEQELAVTREAQQALKDLADIFPSLWI